MSILVCGTVALDNLKTPFGQRKNILGGSASHFSMSSRHFSDVHIAAVVGEDFPQEHIDFLRKKKINLDSLEHKCGKSFKWSGEYKGDLNSAITIHTELGVLPSFNPKITQEQSKIKYIFLANVDPEIQNKFLDDLDAPKLVGLDTMNFWIHSKKESLFKVLSRVDIFVANDQEMRDLSGEVNLLKAAKVVSTHGPKMILIKKGEHGVIFYSPDFILAMPAYPTEKVIDPTGAGDTFAGGFMGYLAKAKKLDAGTIKKALAYATVCASFNVEAFGLEKTSALTLKEIDARLKHFREIVLF